MTQPKQSSQIPSGLSRNVKLFSRIFHMAFIESFYLEKQISVTHLHPRKSAKRMVQLFFSHFVKGVIQMIVHLFTFTKNPWEKQSLKINTKAV